MEWEKEFRFQLDEVFETMNSYTGKMIYDDALFERVLLWGRSFVRSLLSQHDRELVEKLERLKSGKQRFDKKLDKKIFKAEGFVKAIVFQEVYVNALTDAQKELKKGI